MMKNPEVKEALHGKSDDEELEELLQAVDITDDDDLQSLTKKQSAQLTKVVKYFTKKIAKAESNAVETATKDTREKEAAAIQKFSDDNPGMKNQDVVDLMQPLYDKGKSLEDCYATACKALDLDPTTGIAPVAEDKEKSKEAKGDKEEPAKKEKTLISSAKSTLQDDTTPPDEEKEKKSEAPLTLDEALANSSAAYIAKHGSPFEKKE